MDLGSIKEPQSRLRKWTTVDSISVNSTLDQNASKNGRQVWGVEREVGVLPTDCEGQIVLNPLFRTVCSNTLHDQYLNNGGVFEQWELRKVWMSGG